MSLKQESQANLTTHETVATAVVAVALGVILLGMLFAAVWNYETPVEKANGGVFHFKEFDDEP